MYFPPLAGGLRGVKSKLSEVLFQNKPLAGGLRGVKSKLSEVLFQNKLTFFRENFLTKISLVSMIFLSQCRRNELKVSPFYFHKKDTQTEGGMVLQIKTIAVIGGGTMGSGIATATAKAGLKTVLIEKTQDLALRSLESITRELNVQIARWAMTEAEKKLVLTNLEVGSELPLVQDADLVIAAVPDDFELQEMIFKKLSDICQPDTIFSTVTGVLSITALASALDHPEKMLGLHFLNPVLKTKLVEVVRGFRTSDDTYATGKAFVSSLGKKSIEAFESSGVITTRLIVPLLNEAMYALLEGVASADDIDMAMKLGYNMPVGPLELADRIGLDILLGFMEHLFKETGESKFRPCPSLKKYVRAQYLGVKVGEGFFKYDKETGRRIPSRFPG